MDEELGNYFDFLSDIIFNNTHCLALFKTIHSQMNDQKIQLAIQILNRTRVAGLSSKENQDINHHTKNDKTI